MSFKFYVILSTLLWAANQVMGQIETNQQIEDLLEVVAENLLEEEDISELTERLAYYRNTPLNLNKASADDLKELSFLTPLQIHALLDHIHTTGKIIDLLELQAIEHFDLKTIEWILPYVSINNLTNKGEGSWLSLLKKFGKHDLLFRVGRTLENQKGYQVREESGNSRYLGSPYRYLSRYRFNFSNQLQLAINMKKDAGEVFLKEPNSYGFDFYSASLSLSNIKNIKRLVIGDYSLQFGQGLALFTGFGFGKSADIAMIPKVGRGLLPYTSTNEINFLRGIATTLKFKSFEISPFISYKNVDASLEQHEDHLLISSLQQTGLHRTPNEIANKSAARQLVYGSNFVYNQRNFQFGIVSYQTNFNYAFEPGKRIYDQFDFAADKLNNTSAYYHYNIQNIYLYGEAAKSSPGGTAYINGLLASLSPRISFSMVYRNYQRDYASFFNQALAEGSKAVNEKGLYNGLTVKFNKRWELTTYADLFKFPWLKYRVDAPSSGFEIFSQLSYTPSKKFRSYIRYRLKEKQQNSTDKQSINFLDNVYKQNLRLDVSYPYNKSIQLKNRLEIVAYQKGDALPGYGYLAYQDIIYKPLSSKLTGNFRIAYFKSADYDSRIYAFENDLLHSYTILPFFNTGFRTYINTRYTIYRGLDLWLKYAATIYSRQQSVGSGLDLIAGNKKSEIKAQMRYQF